MKLTRMITGSAGMLAILLAGCGSSSGPQTGQISVGVSDGPVHDANKVCVAFDEIEFKSGSDTIIEPLADNINLLNFQGMNAAPLIFNYELPAGDYQWMRLGVNAELGAGGGTGNDSGSMACQGDLSYIEMKSGAVHNLYVPSGALSGLKLVGGFTVPVNGSADFTAEFDLMKSVTAPNGLQPDVVLRPTIRLVNNIEVGSLLGDVSGDLVAAEGCEPSVYVFDDGITPNPIDMEVVDEEDPVATAMVNEMTDNAGQTTYEYTVGYLLPGDYEVAFTCNGTDFEPADGKPATIVAQQLTEVDFP